MTNWRVEVYFTDESDEDAYSQEELNAEIQRVIQRELYLKITKLNLHQVIQIADGITND